MEIIILLPSSYCKLFGSGLSRLGFQQVRQKGSHIRFAHPDGRKTTIPDHGDKDVPKGLLSKIIRYDLEMDLSDFWK
jgi:predicted RNA binding protein YcfA (HicA-like mRNA interferase family)